jgi:hypothetical protein
MMKRRDLLCNPGGVGAATAVARVLDLSTAGGQSFPAVSGRATTDSLASRLAESIQKHNVPGASAAVSAPASGRSRRLRSILELVLVILRRRRRTRHARFGLSYDEGSMAVATDVNLGQ